MDYKNKYLKYKMKYINLISTSCMLQDIFDLDCILPLTNNKDDDYIFNNRLSSETIEKIRKDIQQYYEYFYNYMMFPNLPYDKLKTDDLRDEIIIPIIKKEMIVNNKTLSLDYVDYDIMAKKLKNINIYSTLNVYVEFQKVIEEYKNLIKNIKNENKDIDFMITDLEIDILNYKNNNLYSQIDNINSKIFKKYKEYFDEYNQLFDVDDNLRKENNILIKKYNEEKNKENRDKIDIELDSIKEERNKINLKIQEKKKLFKNILELYDNSENRSNFIFEKKKKYKQYTTKL